MNDLLIEWFTQLNSFLIRMTGGKIGSQLGTQCILILRTVGRKTGQPRATPIAYFDYQGKYLRVASNLGRDKHADWLLNLRGRTRARIDVKAQSLPVRARKSQGDEYMRRWKLVTERHAQYIKYQQMTSRRIPIVVPESAR